ncbi:MAG: hypothetical protein U0Q55_02565 [Vicinamibacterales bacterium]
MSPILVRPVREQLEHDRIIRLLHGKSRRKYDAGMNPGAEQNAPVSSPGGAALYPDLVLHSPERGRRLEVVVEVETGESVNHLEALAEWAHFAKLRAAFHLYVPSHMAEVARHLCDDNQITVTEVWSYHAVGDDIRFALIHKSKDAPVLAPLPKRMAEPAPKAPKAVKAVKAAKPARVVKTAKPAKASKPAKPARKAAPVAKRPAKRAPARAAKPVAPRRKPAPVRKKVAARPTKRK